MYSLAVRRAIGLVVAGSTLFTTVASPAAAAVAGATGGLSNAGAPRSVTTEDAPVQTRKNTAGWNGSVPSGRFVALRGMTRSDLDSLRAQYTRYASKSRRGAKSVAMSLKVIEALSAPTEAQYRARLAELPIAIVRTLTRDEHGRAGIETSYMLNGTKRGSRFILMPPAGQGAIEEEPASRGAEVPFADGESASSIAGPMTTPSSGLTYCEYTDDDNVFWSGDCATQQEIDDATVIVMALDADSEGMSEEASEDLYYCQTVLNLCWEESRSDGQSAVLGSNFGGPSGEVACAAGTAVDECYARALAFTGTVVTYGMRASRLWGALMAAGPVGAAVAGHVVLVIGAGAAMVGAGIAFHDCVYAT